MLRALSLTLGLLVASPAFACGGGKCPDDACGKAAAKVESPDIHQAEGTQVTFQVEGMKCGACSSKISAALLETEGVKAATVDHEAGVAQVVFDDAKTNSEALLKVITGLNYKAEVKPVES
ncbi:MAG: heavy-metal-associated domain-containing protein [Alphaproteobacteria bacterium]|nr:heavy-metal-associated domain-containing protein [Alphaproteobacteria bacterium]MCB9795927.1 heavy-metal-associated domain-containing protein [Alphaproteobacteria bacterium]